MNTTALIKPYPQNWRLADAQRDELLADLIRIDVNPYREPEAFLDCVHSTGAAAQAFCDKVSQLRRNADLDNNPVLYIKNLPVENHLPVFGHDDPIGDKYTMKSTFVTEAILALFASAAHTPIIAYRTINNGDLFHDIYLKESLKHTASQKSMVSFGFHYDMGFKRARPDWANLACLRSSGANCVSTSVSRNIDLLNDLSPADLEVLSRPVFATPPEVVSVMGGAEGVVPSMGPIYFPDRRWKFEYFEGRTTTALPEGMDAIRRLDAVLHRTKRHLVLEPGDLAAVSNNHGTHCREVINIQDMAAHRQRWLIKTYNVEDLSMYGSTLVTGMPRTANE